MGINDVFFFWFCYTMDKRLSPVVNYDERSYKHRFIFFMQCRDVFVQ